MIRRAVLLLSLICTVWGATIDNGIDGEPDVECSAGSIMISFKTKNDFEGHIYVKGQYNTQGCRANATLLKGANLRIPFDNCDSRRQRSSNPKGMYVSTTVVIKFHPMFITMIDRAYNVKCFYMEAEKTVNAQLNVSDLVPDTIVRNLTMPTCVYKVLADGPQGAPVSFSTVGSTVYHQWSCAEAGGNDTASAGAGFCMTVHSCSVDNGRGKQVLVLDENGCAMDKFLLTNIDYTADLIGGQSGMVFKFPDQSNLFFQCQIRLEVKDGDKCVRASDKCLEPTRGKREATAGDLINADENSIDVYSQFMTVFDIDDPINSQNDERMVRLLNDRVWSPSTGGASSPSQHSVSVTGHKERAGLCLSPMSFGLLIAALVTVLLTALVVVAVLCCRPSGGVEDSKRLRVSS